MVRICVVAWALAMLAGCGDSTSKTELNPPAQGLSQTGDPGRAQDTLPATEAGLYARAQVAEQQGRPDEAVVIYRRILVDYPQSPDNYKAVFLIGFVFSEKLNQPDSARILFESVIRDYPDCEFADDASAMLRFLDGELPPFEDTPNS